MQILSSKLQLFNAIPFNLLKFALALVLNIEKQQLLSKGYAVCAEEIMAFKNGTLATKPGCSM